MKTKKFTLLIAMSLLAALAMPVGMAAQDNPSPDNKPKHKKYRLFDIGTLGGATSYNFSENAKSMNNQATVIGGADTSIPDPNYPNFSPLITGAPNPFLEHAFLWSHGHTVDLGALPGLNTSGSDWVNESGVAAGASTTGLIDPLTGWLAAEAVIWNHGNVIPLGDLGGHESVGIAINDREQVGGFGANAIPDPFSLFGFTTQTRAFVWERGVMRDIGTLGGPDAAILDMSNSGAVGFSYTNSTPNPTTGIPTVDPFFWTRGRMIDLGTLGGTFGGPEWVNNRGQVIGESNLAGDLVSHPFFWDNGVLKDLGTLGGDNGAPFFINEAGTIVGEADLPGSSVHHGFLWKRNVMRDLGAVGSDPCSNATHINEGEQIVGTSTDCHGTVLHVFLWENGQMVDLNALVNPPSDIKLFEPSYINDRGEITGNALLPNGDRHAVVLIPDGDCDGSCQNRIDQSQAEAALGRQSDDALASPASSLSPAERVRSMMRQRLGIPGAHPTLRD